MRCSTDRNDLGNRMSAMRTTTKAIQLMGGYGYTAEYPVELRDTGRFGLADGGADR